MPRVLIGPEVFYQVAGPHVSLLKQAGFDVVYPPRKEGLRGEAETVAALANCEAIIAGGEYFTPRVLDSLHKLRVIARAGVGYDRVDLPAATRQGVAVAITPTANHEAVAEHAMALLLDVARWITRQDKALRQGEWSNVPMQPLRGRTLGIVGLGRIGRSMAVRALAFRMRVVACEQWPDEEFVARHGIELVDLPTLLEQSDYISLHAPLNDDTRHLIDSSTLARMKQGAYLINTARGGLVDEKALVMALESGWLGGAGLDVFEHEPLDPRSPLLKYDNVVLAPHRAGGDVQSNIEMALEAAQAIIDLYQGKWPAAAIVNRDIQAGWKW